MFCIYSIVKVTEFILAGIRSVELISTWKNKAYHISDSTLKIEEKGEKCPVTWITLYERHISLQHEDRLTKSVQITYPGFTPSAV
jgi:hypothetical protein